MGSPCPSGRPLTQARPGWHSPEPCWLLYAPPEEAAQRAAKLDDIAVAIFPIVEIAEVFDDFVEAHDPIQVGCLPTTIHARGSEIRLCTGLVHKIGAPDCLLQLWLKALAKGRKTRPARRQRHIRALGHLNRSNKSRSRRSRRDWRTLPLRGQPRKLRCHGEAGRGRGGATVGDLRRGSAQPAHGDRCERLRRGADLWRRWLPR